MRASQSLDNMRRRDSKTSINIAMGFVSGLCLYTSVELFYDSLQPILKRDGIGGTLECKAKLSVLYSPVMEDGIHLVVH